MNNAGYFLSKIIKKAVQLYHGDYGAAMSNRLSVKYLNPRTNMLLVQTMRSCHLMVMSAMSFIKTIGQHNGFFRTLHVGGTIRSCQKFLIKYHRKEIQQALRQCRSDEETKIVQDTLIAACAKMEKIETEDFSIDDIMGENG
ncbi:ribonuclease P/MRP protein subunit POP5-like isoform X2 [Gigantopelta aegis]|nr:ribonuclease P/MRP protein subunit POP5-like isoform X2 [Gigantopelta aegis]